MNLLRWALSYVDSSARRASESISGGGPPSVYEQLGEIQDQNMSFEPFIRKRLLEELERFIVNGEEQEARDKSLCSLRTFSVLSCPQIFCGRFPL